MVGSASGRVLEFGFGPATNFRCWSEAPITEWVGVDPNIHFDGAVAEQQRRHNLSFPASIVWLQGENVAVPEESFDSVVATHTLCSVQDVTKVLLDPLTLTLHMYHSGSGLGVLSDSILLDRCWGRSVAPSSLAVCTTSWSMWLLRRAHSCGTSSVFLIHYSSLWATDASSKSSGELWGGATVKVRSATSTWSSCMCRHRSACLRWLRTSSARQQREERRIKSLSRRGENGLAK